MGRVLELTKCNYHNRKIADKKLENILGQICFEILHPLSTFIYSKKIPTENLNILSENVFKLIKQSVKLSHKSQTYVDFVEVIEVPINYCRKYAIAASKKESCIELIETPKLLFELKESGEEIFNRLFIPRKRGRKPKYVRKSQRSKN